MCVKPFANISQSKSLGENKYVIKAFHQIAAFLNLFNLKGQNDPFLKGMVLPANRRIAKDHQDYILHSGVSCLVAGRLPIDGF